MYENARYRQMSFTTKSTKDTKILKK